MDAGSVFTLNNATATRQRSPGADPVTSIRTAITVTDGSDPRRLIDLVKTATPSTWPDGGRADRGQIYSYLVTNTGNVTLTTWSR